MDLQPYVERIHQQLDIVAAAGGDDSRALAERLIAPLDAAIRLTLQEALAVAAEEITCELAPGSVELRLRGRDPEFVVTPPPIDQAEQYADEEASSSPAPRAMTSPLEGDEGGMSRINLRLPDQLKARIERAAEQDGLSINAWLVRAATASLERTSPPRQSARRAPVGFQRYTGWAR
jgi:hypothetical protein